MGGDCRSYANGINESGDVVGYSGRSSYDAVFWDSDGIFDLNDFMVDNSGWNLIYAFDINNSDQIVGYGNFNGEYHGYLLTPIPEPATLLILGLGGLVLRKRRA